MGRYDHDPFLVEVVDLWCWDITILPEPKSTTMKHQYHPYHSTSAIKSPNHRIMLSSSREEEEEGDERISPSLGFLGNQIRA